MTDRSGHIAGKCRLAVAVAAVVVVGLWSGSAAGVVPTHPEDVERQATNFDRLDAETAGTAGRVELAVGQGVHGGLVGLEGCLAAGCESSLALAAVPTSTAAAGAGLAWLASPSQGVTPGLANAVNSGALWGGMYGLGAGAVSRTTHRRAMGATMAGHLLGAGAGLWAAHEWRPTGGDVALVNAYGLWSGVLYQLVSTGIVQLDQSPRFGVGSMMAVTGAAKIGGGFLAHHLPVSRTRVGVTSLLGLVGAATGAGMAALVGSSEVGTRSWSTAVLVGAVGGLTGGAVVTRGLDEESGTRNDSTSVGLMAAPDGEGMTGMISGRF